MQNFAAVLDKAKKEGKVLIKKRDGSSFILSPLPLAESPLNVKGINIDLTSQEIISGTRPSLQSQQEKD